MNSFRLARYCPKSRHRRHYHPYSFVDVIPFVVMNVFVGHEVHHLYLHVGVVDIDSTVAAAVGHNDHDRIADCYYSYYYHLYSSLVHVPLPTCHPNHLH